MHEIKNISLFAGTDEKITAEWLKKYYPDIRKFSELKPEKTELAFSIITDRSIEDYREIIKQCEEA